jgi:Holliday junction resolvasome RuvABC endonuclease subunit
MGLRARLLCPAGVLLAPINSMRTLGLDPSLRAFGWAIYDSSPHIAPRQRRVDSGYEGTLSLNVPVARFMHFREMVRNLLKEHEVDAVGIESPAYQGGPFSENHFGLMMYALEAIFEQRKDCVLFDPTTLKFLTGKATASKSDMQRFVQLDTMDTEIINNNEADAYCIAKFAARFLEVRDGTLPPWGLKESEKRTFLTKTRKIKTASGNKIVKRTAHTFRENSRYFAFSKIPSGSVNLPSKSSINSSLLEWLESSD